MSYGGMRNNDYFSKYDNYSTPVRNGRSSMGFGGGSSQGNMFGDSYSRTNSGFGNGMGGFGDRRQSGMGMQNYDMGFNGMARGRTNYSGRGIKRNMSPGSGRMGGGLSTEALMSLGMQAKQLLSNQAAYGPPAPKMRRLNEGYGSPMMRGRGRMHRGVSRGGAVRPRGGASRVQKPKETPAWKKSPFHCNFCQKATNNSKDHGEHVRSKEHKTAAKERQQKLVDQMYSLYQRSQANAAAGRMNGLHVGFCDICCLEYVGTHKLHKRSKDHTSMAYLLSGKCLSCQVTSPNRIEYERHLCSQYHIRNHMYKLMERGELDAAEEKLECPEEYDDSVSVGSQYVSDRRAIYCKACDTLYDKRGFQLNDHFKSKEHFDNFKAFCATRKVELEEKAAKKAEEAAKKAEEAAKKAEEAAAKANEEKEEGAEDGNGEKAEDEAAEVGHNEVEGDDNEVEGDDNEVEGDDNEVEGDDNEVEGDDNEAEDDENEEKNENGDVEMKEDAEEKEEPAAKPTRRSTPRRNAKK